MIPRAVKAGGTARLVTGGPALTGAHRGQHAPVVTTVLLLDLCRVLTDGPAFEARSSPPEYQITSQVLAKKAESNDNRIGAIG